MERIKNAQPGEIFEHEYRVKNTKSKWVPFLVRDTVFKRNENNVVTQIVGIAVDITEIKIAENLGNDVLGRAHNDVIYLSTRIFMQGTKQVSTTLLEEYLHLKFKLEDETYKMQTFLFDMIAGLGEQLKGEPL